jgi:hypothetical protein
MKLLIILLLISVSGIGQTKKDSTKSKYTPSNIFVLSPTPYAAMIKDGSDTLEIYLPLQIHFIKISKAIYRIVEHEATLEFVQPEPAFRFPGGILYNQWGWPNMQPALTDTAVKWKPYNGGIIYLNGL